VTDEELMSGYADGDMDAFQCLYQRHKDRVLGFLVAKLKDRDEAEEVFQTVFTKLHLARGKYQQDIPFLPWIFTISRNALIDHVRKLETYRKHVVTSEVAIETNSAAATDTSSGSIALGELSRLSESQRQALELRFSEGMTFAEIAEQMDISVVNSRQIISRTIRKLRTLMVGKETYDER
jgi:RNA polymerase sigma factor (sigma-70 family)